MILNSKKKKKETSNYVQSMCNETSYYYSLALKKKITQMQISFVVLNIRLNPYVVFVLYLNYSLHIHYNNNELLM